MRCHAPVVPAEAAEGLAATEDVFKVLGVGFRFTGLGLNPKVAQAAEVVAAIKD